MRVEFKLNAHAARVAWGLGRRIDWNTTTAGCLALFENLADGKRTPDGLEVFGSLCLWFRCSLFFDPFQSLQPELCAEPAGNFLDDPAELGPKASWTKSSGLAHRA